MAESMTVRVTGEDDVETLVNALEAAARHRGVDLDRSRGRTADGAVSTGEALVAVAEAYTGWNPEDD